jgi:DNA-binding NtrC family response regulator
VNENYRPAFILVDPEYPGVISSRKLVLETAKLNVITAYSGAEAIETLRRFPAADAVILNADVRDMGCEKLVGQLRSLVPQMQLVVISPNGHTSNCGRVDHQLSTYDPQALLELLRDQFGKPRHVATNGLPKKKSRKRKSAKKH